MTVQLASPTATRIGWIGTGVMGSSMCGHLLTAGYRVTVHSRTRSANLPITRNAPWQSILCVVAGASAMASYPGQGPGPSSST
jgi:3-hydroxyisobutyrate dehydrogenase